MRCLLAKGNNTKHGQARLGRHTPEYNMWSSAKQRAKKAKVPFNIEICDILIPERCPVLGVELKRGIRHKRATSPSLDRIIPSLGYVKGNVWVMSSRANLIKNDATVEELELVVKAIKAQKNFISRWPSQRYPD